LPPVNTESGRLFEDTNKTVFALKQNAECRPGLKTSGKLAVRIRLLISSSKYSHTAVGFTIVSGAAAPQILGMAQGPIRF
jgi:hypothetical protein